MWGLILGVGQAWLCSGRGANAPRPGNVAVRECRLCVRFLSKALKIKLPCLDIYF